MTCRSAAAILAFADLNGVTMAPANAQQGLVSSTPARGSVLTESSAEVLLTFTATPLDGGVFNHSRLFSGATWSNGEPMRKGSTSEQPLLSPLPSGAYEVRWRTVSSDGHPISDTFNSAVETIATTDAPSAPTPTAEPPASEPVDEAGPVPFGVLLLAGMAAIVLMILVRGALRSRKNRA